MAARRHVVGRHAFPRSRQALARCLEILASEITAKDPGVASVMIFGLSRAVEEEPEAAEELLTKLVLVGGIDAIEALATSTRSTQATPLGPGGVQRGGDFCARPRRPMMTEPWHLSRHL